MTCCFTENVPPTKVFFKHFASKSQLPGLSVSQTLVENGLTATKSLHNGNAKKEWKIKYKVLEWKVWTVCNKYYAFVFKSVCSKSNE